MILFHRQTGNQRCPRLLSLPFFVSLHDLTLPPSKPISQPEYLSRFPSRASTHHETMIGGSLCHFFPLHFSPLTFSQLCSPFSPHRTPASVFERPHPQSPTAVWLVIRPLANAIMLNLCDLVCLCAHIYFASFRKLSETLSSTSFTFLLVFLHPEESLPFKNKKKCGCVIWKTRPASYVSVNIAVLTVLNVHPVIPPLPPPNPLLGLSPPKRLAQTCFKPVLCTGERPFVFGMFIIIFIIILPYTSFKLNLTPNLTKFGKHIRTSECFL